MTYIHTPTQQLLKQFPKIKVLIQSQLKAAKIKPDTFLIEKLFCQLLNTFGQTASFEKIQTEFETFVFSDDTLIHLNEMIDTLSNEAQEPNFYVRTKASVKYGHQYFAHDPMTLSYERNVITNNPRRELDDHLYAMDSDTADQHLNAFREKVAIKTLIRDDYYAWLILENED